MGSSICKPKPATHVTPNIPSKKVDLQSFKLVRVIGRGAFGKVILVQRRSNQKFYAMKILRKVDVERRN